MTLTVLRLFTDTGSFLLELPRHASDDESVCLAMTRALLIPGIERIEVLRLGVPPASTDNPRLRAASVKLARLDAARLRAEGKIAEAEALEEVATAMDPNPDPVKP